MYCKSNNSVLDQSMVCTIGSYEIKSVVTYAMNGLFEKIVMNGLFEKIGNSFCTKKGIEGNVSGYNSEKYEQLEKLYSMTYTGLNSLEKNYIVASAALDEIVKLDDDWNNNGASSFSRKLIEKCRGILTQLVAEPFICPTACGSIQFEYEKENGEYLEFEIYEDRIEAFLDTLSNGEQEFTWKGISATDKMKQMVVDFYG